MNVIIAHGFAHRVTEAGIIESAPIELSEKGSSFMIRDVWEQRDVAEMDITGADFELIRNTLDLFRHTFIDGAPRVPKSESGAVDYELPALNQPMRVQ